MHILYNVQYNEADNSTEMLENMALRVENVRPLKTSLTEEMMKATTNATLLLMDSLINKEESKKSVTRNRMDKCLIPLAVKDYLF